MVNGTVCQALFVLTNTSSYRYLVRSDQFIFVALVSGSKMGESFKTVNGRSPERGLRYLGSEIKIVRGQPKPMTLIAGM